MPSPSLDARFVLRIRSINAAVRDLLAPHHQPIILINQKALRTDP
jgi:hypothetical protein